MLRLLLAWMCGECVGLSVLLVEDWQLSRRDGNQHAPSTIHTPNLVQRSAPHLGGTDEHRIAASLTLTPTHTTSLTHTLFLYLLSTQMGKPRGIRCGRKMRTKRRLQKWNDLDWNKSHSLTHMKANPFGASNHHSSPPPPPPPLNRSAILRTLLALLHVSFAYGNERKTSL